MATTQPELDSALIRFIEAQKLFFVGSAPLAQDGHVNVSPKGAEGLRILDTKTIAYLDLIGSGVETVAHLRENGRIVLMFCALEGPPKIVRIHGRGRSIEPQDEAWSQLALRFPSYAGARCIIWIEIERVTSSCGYGVPLYRYEGEREQMQIWADRKGEDGLQRYKEEKNRESIDGLPALRLP